MNSNNVKSKPQRSKLEAPIAIEMVPDELLESVFKFLPLNSKKNARLVCQRWCRILNPQFTLHVQLSDKTISNVKYFTQAHLGSLTVKKLSQDILITHHSPNVPPTISKVILSEGIPHQNLVSVLKYYNRSNIEELEFASLSNGTGTENIWELVSALKKWNNLKILKLTVKPHHNPAYLNRKYFGEFARHCEALAGVLKYVHAPSLTTLSLNLDSGPLALNRFNTSTSTEHPFENICMQLVTFLQRHHTSDNLKCLDLECVGDCIQFDPFRFYPREFSTKSIVQLESINLKGLKTHNYLLALLSQQKNVKHIKMETFYAKLINVLLANNSQTIESLSIYGATNELLFPSKFVSLKCLSIGFDGIDSVRAFLNMIRQEPLRFPSLGILNIIVADFLIGTFALSFFANDARENLQLLLNCILIVFPTIKKFGFIIRGDSTHISEFKSASIPFLEQVQDLKIVSITDNQVNVTFNVLPCLKASDEYYDGGVEFVFEEAS